MIYFDSDYMVGAHPDVLKQLIATNGLHTIGYGYDEFCTEARKTILTECGIDNGEVFFMEGGTQTNSIIINRLLDYGEGVLATDLAHINVHEAGAIEATGHKVLTLPHHNGKISAEDIHEYIATFYQDSTYPHMVAPGMVYISFPTELGTLYTRQELEAIYAECHQTSIPLYIDGARMAYGLAASPDLTLSDIAELCDVFYIGGTKCGTLFGEAVVTAHPELLPRFVTIMKRQGALLAKGRLLGVQFSALFNDGLYYAIGRHAVNMAMKLKKVFTDNDYKLYIDSPTNQQFIVLPNEVINNLRQIASFELWGSMRERETPVRFVTDWATTEQDIDTLQNFLTSL